MKSVIVRPNLCVSLAAISAPLATSNVCLKVKILLIILILLLSKLIKNMNNQVYGGMKQNLIKKYFHDLYSQG